MKIKISFLVKIVGLTDGTPLENSHRQPQSDPHLNAE
jgi:hypothetical protein